MDTPNCWMEPLQRRMKEGTVSRIDIGNVDKACVIAMLNQRQFAESYVTIWEDGEYREYKQKGIK